MLAVPHRRHAIGDQRATAFLLRSRQAAIFDGIAAAEVVRKESLLTRPVQSGKLRRQCLLIVRQSLSKQNS